MRILAAAALLVLLAAGSFLRNATWQDDEQLWGDTISKTPDKARAYNELGLSLLAAGRYPDALAVGPRAA